MTYKTGRFIDPLSDFGFKHLFGSEPNKDILIDFLNQLFKGQKEITDLTYSPTEHDGDKESYKKIFFDLLCTGANGEQFIIEMQRAGQRNFADRAIFYTSRLINELLPKGENHWNIALKEVYLIAILEFNLKSSPADHYLHNVSLSNTVTGEIFYDKLGYKFLELPNFVKIETELETDLDRWFYILKHMSHLDKMPAVFNKRVFQKLFNIAEISNLTTEEKAMYDSNLKAKWDYENSIAYAEEKAEERGIEKGIEKGMEQGRHQEALNIARELKREGSSVEFIAKITKLPLSEIENL